MKVVVYTKKGCSQCEMTKRRLKKKKIEFKVVKADEHPTAVFDLVLLGFKQLPVVSVNDFEKSWTGFKPNNIDELAEKMKGLK